MGRAGAHNRKRRDAPARTRRTTLRPLALPQQRTAAAAEARTPGSSPHRLSAVPTACANGAILPARSFLNPSKITVKAVCARRPTANGQGDQVHVHTKTTLTAIFHRFDPAPVGRMARTELSPSGTAGKFSIRIRRNQCPYAPQG